MSVGAAGERALAEEAVELTDDGRGRRHDTSPRRVVSRVESLSSSPILRGRGGTAAHDFGKMPRADPPRSNRSTRLPRRDPARGALADRVASGGRAPGG